MRVYPNQEVYVYNRDIQVHEQKGTDEPEDRSEEQATVVPAEQTPAHPAPAVKNDLLLNGPYLSIQLEF